MSRTEEDALEIGYVIKELRVPSPKRYDRGHCEASGGPSLQLSFQVQGPGVGQGDKGRDYEPPLAVALGALPGCGRCSTMS